MLPMPRLVVFGATPVAQALAALAGALDFDVSVVDERAEESTFPGIERMDPTTADPSTLLGPDSFVVVATQGDGDEEALRAALAGESAYLGLVASRKKGRTILDFLEAQGMSTDRLGTVRYPAGLDLGGMTPPEIALSVLAEIVAVRAGKAKEDVAVEVVGGPSGTSPGLPIHPAHHGAPQATHGAAGTAAASHDATAGTAIDPVCGMTVKIEGARYRSEHDGEAFYFCCPMCQAAFDKDPSAYGGATTG